ncbi:Lacal_2735 family protein [Pseudotamlana agarivorans]|uniref:Lacal_2735 family protein n=1 Tax=Pseudotamlana agarivorans TaxID=481183 RepID=UPI000AC3050F|nr:Lacal_2735 family protein [Tamlana agarivorans]
MNTSYIKTQQAKLLSTYKQLMEQAYNFRQMDSALSDILEFKAIKLLNELNGLRFLNSNQLIYCKI